MDSTALNPTPIAAGKVFLNKVLAGTATGIVVGLIPNAILGELFKALSNQGPIFTTLLHITQGLQFTVPIIVGVLIAMQFNFNAMQTIIIGGAGYVASGALAVSVVDGQTVFTVAGIGDLINTMLTASIAVLLMMWVGDKLGSLTIILMPMIVGVGAGLIGVTTLPYVRMITTGIGEVVNSFTTLQPLLMSILIAASFSVIIVSPVSTVAVSMAIGLTGLSSGAANIGICAAASLMVIGTAKVNKSGVPLAIGLGAMKMMMPNLIKYPILALPISLTAALSGIGAALFNIQGVPASAGFGYSGLIGPINALKFMEGGLVANLFPIILTFFVIPFASAFIVDFVLSKVLKVYGPEIFVFEPTK